MNAHVDKSLCVGCEMCVQICPAVFFMDSDGKAEAGTVPVSEETACKEGADGCPVSAISVAE